MELDSCLITRTKINCKGLSVNVRPCNNNSARRKHLGQTLQHLLSIIILGNGTTAHSQSENRQVMLHQFENLITAQETGRGREDTFEGILGRSTQAETRR